MKKKYVCLHYNVDGEEISTQYPAKSRTADKLGYVMSASIAEEGNYAYAYSIKTYREVKLEYIETEDSGMRYINGRVVTKDELQDMPLPAKDELICAMEDKGTDKAVILSDEGLTYPFVEGKDKVIRVIRLNKEDMVEGHDI